MVARSDSVMGYLNQDSAPGFIGHFERITGLSVVNPFIVAG